MAVIRSWCFCMQNTSIPNGSTAFAWAWARAIVVTLVILSVGRLSLWLGPAGLVLPGTDAATAWRVGLRFDLLVATWLATPILGMWLVGSIHPTWRFRMLRWNEYWIAGSAVMIVAVSLLNFGFFCEYRDQFNVWVLGLVNDDACAVGATVLAEYHWGRYLLAFAGISTLVVWGLSPVLRRLTARYGDYSGRRAAMISLAAVVLCAPLGYRGGLGRRPPQLKDVAVCSTDAANRLVLNPVFALKHVLIDRWAVSNSGRPPAFVGDIRQQTVLAFGQRGATAARVSDLITVRNEAGLVPSSPPRRVYYLVLESYDRWPMLPKYAGLGLCESLKALEREGATAPNFISGDSGTMPSLSAIMSGIPPVDVAQNYRPRGSVALPTAIAPIFKKLGYRTRFAYCGYGSWQRVADYAKAQGFEEIVLGSDVACDPEERGEWGVPDGRLYDHLAKLDRQDPRPVFTLVMSASYHPPYAHNLEKLGCTEASLPPALAPTYDGVHSMRVFSHLKYADVVLGKFIRETHAACPDSLFAVTGDHWSRKFLNKAPELDERRQVPFVLYGPRYVPAGTQLPHGAHVDIAPTLIRLCAAEGFSYQTFGTDLLSSAARIRQESYGNGTVAHVLGGFDLDSADISYGLPPESGAAPAAVARIQARRALAWWYFERGDTLP